MSSNNTAKYIVHFYLRIFSLIYLWNSRLYSEFFVHTIKIVHDLLALTILFARDQSMPRCPAQLGISGLTGSFKALQSTDSVTGVLCWSFSCLFKKSLDDSMFALPSVYGKGRVSSSKRCHFSHFCLLYTGQSSAVHGGAKIQWMTEMHRADTSFKLTPLSSCISPTTPVSSL